MDEITFVFGAGASCNSMPLVANFPERFKYWVEYLESNNLQKEFIFSCKQFLSEVENHQSFDTLFKKLFHNKKDAQRDNFKRLLLIYFYFEHSANYKKEEAYYPNRPHSKKEKTLDKKSVIDPRYDALIASLLIPEKSKVEFFKKVNFITWNYDLNLQQALVNFTSDSETLFAFQKKYSFEKYYESESFSLVTLNGSIIHPKLLFNTSIAPDNLRSNIDSLIEESKHEDSDLSEYAKSISFAWEHNDIKTKVPSFMHIAKNCINRSKHIIVIGYSFPLYNRLTDNILFNRSLLHNKNLILQNIETNITKTFSEGFNISTETDIYNSLYTTIKYVEDCKSFYVPKDVFIS